MKLAKILFVPVLAISLIFAACTGSSKGLTTTTTTTGLPNQPGEKPSAPSQTPTTQTGPNVSPAPAVATAPAINAQVPPVPGTPPVKPGDFLVSNLKIVPNTVRLFNSANVSVTVTNNGTKAGSSTAALNVKTDGLEVMSMVLPASHTVSLAPGESTTVTFNVEVMGLGTHIVTIDSLSERLTVDSSI